jgi:hypothetical protein
LRDRSSSANVILKLSCKQCPGGVASQAKLSSGLSGTDELVEVKPEQTNEVGT